MSEREVLGGFFGKSYDSAYKRYNQIRSLANIEGLLSLSLFLSLLVHDLYEKFVFKDGQRCDR